MCATLHAGVRFCPLVLLAACRSEPDPAVAEQVALELWPRDPVVTAGVDVPLRAVAVDADGRRFDVDAVITRSDGTEVADGVVPAGEGEVLVEASSGSFLASTRVSWTTDAALDVRVVDAGTGSAVPSAVVVWPSGLAIGDEEGRVHASAAGPVPWLTVIAARHVPTTLLDVRARDVVVPMRRSDHAIEATGTADLSGSPAGGPADLVVGFCAASVGRTPASYDPATLFAADRTVTIGGAAVTLPGNVFAALRPDLALSGVASAPVAWCLAGPVPIAEVVDVASREDAADLLGEAVPHLAWSATLLQDGLVAAPTVPLEATFVAITPDDRAATVLAADSPYGVVTGFGRGSGYVAVWTTGALAPRAVAVLPAGTFDENAGFSLGVAPVLSGTATLPPWLAAPVAGPWTSSGFTLDADARATVALLLLTDADGRSVADVWFPPGDFARASVVPTADAAAARVVTIELDRDTWDGVTGGGLVHLGAWTRAAATAPIPR